MPDLHFLHAENSDGTFTNDPILLNGSLVVTKGTDLNFVRTILFFIVYKFHCLVPNAQFILHHYTFNK